jgi:hypothetical protein
VEGAPGARWCSQPYRLRGLQSRGEERAAASQQAADLLIFSTAPLMHDQEELSPSLGRADTSTYRDPHSGDGVRSMNILWSDSHSGGCLKHEVCAKRSSRHLSVLSTIRQLASISFVDERVGDFAFVESLYDAELGLVKRNLAAPRSVCARNGRARAYVRWDVRRRHPSMRQR